MAGLLDGLIHRCHDVLLMDWIKSLAAKFIVFDGPDGSGKSTQFKRFAAHCRAQGQGVCEVREPGGTSIGEQIRTVLLDPANTDMSLRCEMLLYMASRAQLIEQIIRPALEEGQLVLADRFISSTLAYQGTASGLPLDEITKVGEVAIGNLWPDLVVIFDVDEVTAAQRIIGDSRQRKPGKPIEPSLFADRLELRGAQYQRRVRQGFLDQANRQPDRYLIIDASADPEAVFTAVMDGLKKRFAGPKA